MTSDRNIWLVAKLRTLFPKVPLIALTATADTQTRQDVRRRLGLLNAPCYVASFDRPNLRLTVVEKRKPVAQLTQFLTAHPGEAGIVYCLSRQKTEEVAKRLAAAGVPPPPTTPVCRQTGAPRYRKPSSVTTYAWWWPPWPSAWVLTSPMCGSWSISICPSTSRATTRRWAAPAGTACPLKPSCYSHTQTSLECGRSSKGQDPDQTRVELHKLNAGRLCRRPNLPAPSAARLLRRTTRAGLREL